MGSFFNQSRSARWQINRNVRAHVLIMINLGVRNAKSWENVWKLTKIPPGGTHFSNFLSFFPHNPLIYHIEHVGTDIAVDLPPGWPRSVEKWAHEVRESHPNFWLKVESVRKANFCSLGRAILSLTHLSERKNNMKISKCHCLWSMEIIEKLRFD